MSVETPRTKCVWKRDEDSWEPWWKAVDCEPYAGAFDLPKFCPFCGGFIELREDE